MKELNIEDVKRAVQTVHEKLNHKSYVVIGGGALSVDDRASSRLRNTVDVDVVDLKLKDFQEGAKISRELGEGSEFQKENGYYVQVLHPLFVQHLPSDWDKRAINLRTEKGLEFQCLSPVDVGMCKLFAGRDKDQEHLKEMVKLGMCSETELAERLKQTKPGQDQDRQAIRLLNLQHDILEENGNHFAASKKHIEIVEGVRSIMRKYPDPSLTEFAMKALKVHEIKDKQEVAKAISVVREVKNSQKAAHTLSAEIKSILQTEKTRKKSQGMGY